MKTDQVWNIETLQLARLPVPGWECVFGRNDCAMRDLSFWVWILKSGNQTGMIDTGLPEGPALEHLNRVNQTLDPRSVFTVEHTLETALARMGIAPEEINFVLITQLVTYSTGGLLRQNLPNAQVYCVWEGVRELLLDKPGHPPREFYFTPESWGYLHELLMEDRVTFAEGPLEVAPGIIFEPTGGHHPGSAGVRIRTSKGTLGILETAFVQENIESEIPIGIAENAARCRDAIRKYKRECDFVVAGHDPQVDLLIQEFTQ